MDMEKLAQELREAGDLTDAVGSPEGRAVAAQLDEAALRDAAKRGDSAALKQMLQKVLSTPEGKALAERVQKAVGKK